MTDLDDLQELERRLAKYAHGFALPARLALNLDRMRGLLAALGNPERDLRIIHVAGTSGKGTTSAMAASILSYHGLRVGLHLSPYIQLVTESWQVDGRPIAPALALETMDEIEPEIQRAARGYPLGSPTYFECKIALGMRLFQKLRVDAVVLETGLGGRLDSTNVVLPKVAVVTNVGLDHTHILGDTVEQIAQEKMHIIKPSCVAISGATQPTVQRLIRAHAASVGAELWELGRDISYTRNGSISVATPSSEFSGLWSRMGGDFQAANICLGLAATEAFGVPLDANVARDAIASVHLPARLEVLQTSPTVVLDGAHNTEKLSGTLRWIRETYPGRRVVSIVAIKRTKDAGAMLALLQDSVDSLVLTNFGQVGPWSAEDPVVLRAICQEIGYEGRIAVEPVPEMALSDVINSSDSSDVVLITGSLYLAGRIRSQWESVEDLLAKKADGVSSYRPPRDRTVKL